jgi:hypothetical protein
VKKPWYKMKRLLLFFAIVLIAVSIAFSQSSFSERLNVRNPDEQLRSDLQLYPNPVTTFIGLSPNEVVKKIIVFNLAGREMKSFDFVDGEKYYVGDLPKGMYLVQLLGKENEIIKTHRISKR